MCNDNKRRLQQQQQQQQSRQQMVTFSFTRTYREYSIVLSYSLLSSS